MTTGAELLIVFWPLGLMLFGEIATTNAGSVATGAVDAAFTAAVLVPSVVFTDPITFVPPGMAVWRLTCRLPLASAARLTMLEPFFAPMAVPEPGNAAAKLEDVPPLAAPAATLTLRLPLASRLSGTMLAPVESFAPTAV